MELETNIATGAQTILSFLIISTEQWSTIHRLPADIWTGAIGCNIGKNHMIFCRHVDHKCYYEVKKIKYAGYVLYSFSSCHKFSIGLQSGDSEGVLYQLTPLAVSQSLALLDVCLGSLSAINLCHFGYICWRKGNKVCCSTWMYSGASIDM